MSTTPASRREVPAATVARLPRYLRALQAAASCGTRTMSSEELAELTGVRPAGLRKDLSHLGSYGVRGVGYDVEHLIDQIASQLGVQREWSVAIIGMGNLGHALADHSGFAARGFHVEWLVDSDPKVIGSYVAGRAVIGFDQLADVVTDCVIAVIATPADGAQQAAESAVAAGIRSILNFAPVPLQLPEDVDVRQVDLATELQILAFLGQRGRDTSENELEAAR